MTELLAALCLIAVFEGLFLFVAPRLWKQAAEQLLRMPDPQVRRYGGVVLALGLAVLWWMKH